MSEWRSQTIVVLFSCGAASAVAAKLTVDQYGTEHNVIIVNNEVVEEGEDNRRFLHDVSAWIGRPVVQAVNPKFPKCSAEDVWEREKGMSFVKGAPCTRALKKEARQIWERDNPSDWIVLGFSADEKERHDRFVLTERSDVLPVLIDAGMTKQDCADYIVAAGLRLPEAYAKGYPNANCPGCVKATSPTYWNHVRKVDPDVFYRRAEQSRRLGARLVRVNNKRIYLDELDPLAKGRPMKALKMPECGVLCEERL